MFIIVKGLPYFYKDGKVHPCKISATSVFVDFKKSAEYKSEVKCLYSEDEIRQVLNIKLVDSWDAKEKKVVKVSNQVVSSIKTEKKETTK